MSLIALVAAKNAAASVGRTVDALRNVSGVDEVWVVDDGSTDNTAQVAGAAGARVVRLERNHGKGGALAAGVAATPHAERYLLADADLGPTASGLQPLVDQGSPLVVGRLPSAGGRGGFGLVSRVARAGIRRACGVDPAAPLSGQRLVDGARLRSLALAPRFGVEVAMTIDLVRAGVPYAEVPVDVEHDHRGRSLGGFAHRARQGVDVAGALLPRLSTETQRLTAVVLIGVAVFLALTGLSSLRQAPGGNALPRTASVVLYAYHGLSLDDVGRDDLPALESLRRRGSVGALSVRTSDRRSLGRQAGPERPSLADAYVSLGASARVRAGRNMRESRRLARRDHADSLPGALGDALRRAGKTTAATGTATFAVADRHGDVGDDPADVVLVDSGGAQRSLTATDAALSNVMGRVSGDTTLIVFAPTPPGQEWELTPIIVVAPGVPPGSVASATTRRHAIAGLVDIAPTVLAAFGIDPPDTMTGTPLRFTSEKPDLAAIERLQTDGAVRSRFFLPAAVGFTVAGIAYVLALTAALRRGVPERVRRGFRVGACVAAAFPLALLILAAMQHWWGVGGESPVALVAVSGAVGVVASRIRGLGPVYVLAALVLAIIAVDVAVTGPLQAASILGYSIQTTGRYYGLPNASFSVFAASLFLVAAAVAGWSPTRVRATAAATVLAVGTAFAAAPWLGSDVGGLFTLVPVSAAVVWVLFGRRLTLRAIVIGGVAVVVMLAGLAILGARGGTHLAGASTATVTRRVEANFGLLVSQWWGFASLAFTALVMVLLGPLRRFADYLPAGSGLRACTMGVLATSIVGFLVNDSGPVVNVLCLTVLAPALALVALTGPRVAAGAGPGR